MEIVHFIIDMTLLAIRYHEFSIQYRNPIIKFI
jgi:hypothetical protein